jgi:DNA-binding CsgD family transcriptional regulator
MGDCAVCRTRTKVLAASQQRAVALGIGSRTVSTHVSRVLKELGVSSRTAAARTAILDGLAVPPADDADRHE